MTIKQIIEYGKNELKISGIEDFAIISKLLAKHVLKMESNELIIRQEDEVKKEQEEYYKIALAEIINGKPLQYITNKQEFYGSDFYVDENVLIPQPDTEILVEEVLKITDIFDKEVKILDMCTGSGCIGISIAKKNLNEKIYMVDISKEAIEIAKKNAKNILGENAKLEFIESDMFDEIEEEFDIIVSNPPYIKTDEIKHLSEDVQNEPIISLDGGEDGLDFYRILVEESFKYLSDNGYLCMEIGYDQKDKVIDLLKQNGNYKNIKCIKDLSGNDRVIVAQLKI